MCRLSSFPTKHLLHIEEAMGLSTSVRRFVVQRSCHRRLLHVHLNKALGGEVDLDTRENDFIRSRGVVAAVNRLVRGLQVEVQEMASTICGRSFVRLPENILMHGIFSFFRHHPRHCGFQQQQRQTFCTCPPILSSSLDSID